MSTIGDMQSVGLGGWWITDTGGAPDTTPPGAPTLALASRGDASIALTYTPPDDADYASGEIEWDDGITVDAVPATTGGSYTVSGLTAGTVYRFTARAQDASGNWSARSVAVVATPSGSSVIASCLNETKLQITNLAIGGAGATQVFKGRRPKNYVQSKRISINVYNGDFTRNGRPSTTGTSYIKFPVHIHVTLKRMDKVTGESQTELMAGYMLELQDALDLLRPDDLSTPIENFFSTEVSLEDIDTETDATSSESVGVDQSIEGYLTVWWEFWRPN